MLALSCRGKSPRMYDQSRPWLAYLGVRTATTEDRITTVPAVGAAVLDSSGVEFIALGPDQEKTGAVQEGVNLVFRARVTSAEAVQALEFLDPIYDRLLNILSFRLLMPVIPLALEIVEDKPADTERDMLLAPGYSPIGASRFTALGFSSQGGVPVEGFPLEANDNLDAAMRWFARGLKSPSPIDSFISYWLALEALSTPGLAAPLTMRCCGYLIPECPSCGVSTMGPTGMSQRIQRFLKELTGKEDKDIRRLWELRNLVFHGSSKVFKEAIDIAKTSLELRAIAVKAIKTVMNLTEDDYPKQSDSGVVVAQQGLIGRYLSE
jgi:hypothetical protein